MPRKSKNMKKHDDGGRNRVFSCQCGRKFDGSYREAHYKYTIHLRYGCSKGKFSGFEKDLEEVAKNKSYVRIHIVIIVYIVTYSSTIDFQKYWLERTVI